MNCKYCHKGKYRTLKIFTSKNMGGRSLVSPPNTAPYTHGFSPLKPKAFQRHKYDEM